MFLNSRVPSLNTGSLKGSSLKVLLMFGRGVMNTSRGMIFAGMRTVWQA